MDRRTARLAEEAAEWCTGDPEGDRPQPRRAERIGQQQFLRKPDGKEGQACDPVVVAGLKDWLYVRIAPELVAL